MLYELKGITKSVNIVELPSTIEKIIGNFTYIEYDPLERSEVRQPTETEPDSDSGISEIIEPDAPLRMRANGESYPDRWCTIRIKANILTPPSEDVLADFKQTTSLIDADNDGGYFWVQGKEEPNVFFTQDFIDGYIRISPNGISNSQQFSKIISDSMGSFLQKTLLDYLKMNLDGSQYITVNLDSYEESIRGSDDAENEIIVLDPNTNLPISQTATMAPSGQSDTYMHAYFSNKILERSKASPMIWNITDRTIELSKLVSSQEKSTYKTRKFSNMFEVVDKVASDTNLIQYNGQYTPSTDLIFELYGWHVLKYCWNGEDWDYVASFLVPPSLIEVYEDFGGSGNVSQGSEDSYYTFKDPYVLYGKTYKYEIRDAWQMITQNLVTQKIRLLLGTQTSTIEIDCTEKLPPNSPSSFGFEYVGNSTIRIQWAKDPKYYIPETTWDGETSALTEIPIEDTGGYLLFVRNSLYSPYELAQQLHISSKVRTLYTTDATSPDKIVIDTENTKVISLVNKVNPEIVGSFVPNDKIQYINDLSAQSYDLEIRSNTDYYIAMCSYDVHGNISTYSEQFFVRRNNVTGEVSTSLISGKGASLAYPNTYIPTKFILSSLAVSGYKNLDIYQTPDTSQAYPTDGNVSIQFIDLETENSVLLQGTSIET